MVLVPQVAVSDSTEGTYVWLVDENHTAQQKYITIDKQEGDNWIVTDGLEPGQMVIKSGFQRLKAGTKVSFKEPETSVVQGENNEKEN